MDSQQSLCFTRFLQLTCTQLNCTFSILLIHFTALRLSLPTVNMAPHTPRLRRERKREARRRQHESIHHVMTDAQPQAQALPRKRFQFKSQGQVSDEARKRDIHSVERRTPGKAPLKQPTSLDDRISRGTLPAKDPKSTRLPEPTQVTSKRARSEEGEQQPNKKARLQPQNASAPASGANHPATEVPLTQRSEKERMAARAKRFASRDKAVPVRKCVLSEGSKPRPEAASVNEDAPKQDITDTTAVQNNGEGEVVIVGEFAPVELRRSHREATAVGKDTTAYDHNIKSAVEKDSDSKLTTVRGIVPTQDLGDTAITDKDGDSRVTVVTHDAPTQILRDICTADKIEDHNSAVGNGHEQKQDSKINSAVEKTGDGGPLPRDETCGKSIDGAVVTPGAEYERTALNGPELDDQKHTSNTPPHLQTSSASNRGSFSRKRSRELVDHFEHSVPKRPRVESDLSHLPTSAQAGLEPRAIASTKDSSELSAGRLAPVQRNNAGQILQKPQVATKFQYYDYEPIERNPSYGLKLFDYGDDSVPIMYSALIKHVESGELRTKPSLYLRQDALALLRQQTWTSSDLGRLRGPKIGPTRIIDDCDLYFREGKVYVATRGGLLLAADYLKLIGVPETQSIRFNGRKPAWAKLAEAKRHYRRIEKTYEPIIEEQKKNGFIKVVSGSTVMVFERFRQVTDGKLVDLAYGMRLDDKVKGFFSYQHTCPMDWNKDPPEGSETKAIPDSKIIDWAKFDYGRILAAVGANGTVPTPSLGQPTSSWASGTSANKYIKAHMKYRSMVQTKKMDTQSNTLVLKALGDTDGSSLKSDNQAANSQITNSSEIREDHVIFEHSQSVSADPMSNLIKEAGLSVPKLDKVTVQNPPKECGSIGDRQESSRHDSQQPELVKNGDLADGNKVIMISGSVAKSEVIAEGGNNASNGSIAEVGAITEGEIMAEVDTTLKQIKPLLSIITISQRLHEWADEDRVDFEDDQCS